MRDGITRTSRNGVWRNYDAGDLTEADSNWLRGTLGRADAG
jgi:hypothetical protein